MTFRERVKEVVDHWAYFLVALLIVGAVSVPAFDYIYKSRIEEKDSKIKGLETKIEERDSRILDLESRLQNCQQTGGSPIQIREAIIDGIGRVNKDLCTFEKPCENLIRGSYLRVELTRNGYASAFLQDAGRKFFNEGGDHMVENLTEGGMPLSPGTEKIIPHSRFVLYIVMSTETFPTFADDVPLDELPAGENIYRWGPVHLRVPSRDCGAAICPE